LPSMERIDEAEEESETAASTEEEVNQLTQQAEEDLTAEDEMHFDTLACFKNRIKEEEEKHMRQQRFLEAKLLQAVTAVEGGLADGDHWLNNTRTPKKEKLKKLTKEDKKLIRARVKKAYAASKKKQTSKMSSDWNALDRQAPIPHVRDPKKTACEAPTVKFQFEREHAKTVTKETQDDHGVPTGHTVETSTCLKDCKVALKTFAHSSDEDGEHWLEALRMVQKELAVEWKKAEQAKTNDATVSFQAIDQMLQHSANAEWMDCISRWDKKHPNKTAETWEKFKLCVVDFAARAVFKPDACDGQKSYLQERVKPFDLSAKEWSLRLETVGGEMPWLMTSALKLQKETAPAANWTDPWVLGCLTEAEQRRILFAKMPPSWNRTIQLTDASRELQDRADIATATSHLATLESLEKADRLRSTRMTGRSSRAGRTSASTRPASRQQNCGRNPQNQQHSGQQCNSGGQPCNSSTCPRCQLQQQLQ